MFMSIYTNMQFEKMYLQRRLKLVRLSQVLMTVGKLFHYSSYTFFFFTVLHFAADNFITSHSTVWSQ